MKKQPADLILDGYLCRCSLWNWYDNSRIEIVDNSLRLDEWQTMVFFMADGHTNIEQLIASVIDRRGILSEEDFRTRILTSAKELISDLQVVKLSERSEGLDFRFTIPLKEQKVDGSQDY